MNKTRIVFLILLISILICVIGCQYNPSQDISENRERNIVYGESDSSTDTHSETDSFEELSVKDPVGLQNDSTKPTIDPSEDNTKNGYEDVETEQVSREPLVKKFDVTAIPDFCGEPFYVLNNNIPFFDDLEKNNTEAFEYYSELDELGRCGVAYANICLELMPVEERGEIGQIRPSGWHTIKYNDIVDGNYLYNRCHLIGYQLAGENANEKNLITGTRYMNIVGMMAFESEVYEYVQETNNHVLYRITPVFENDNLVASGVEMEAYSVEDDGKGVCFNVYMYNVQPGIIIDYSTGESEVDSCYNEICDEKALSETINETTDDYYIIPDCDYVLNTNTMKFHYPSCDSVQDMKEKNREYFTGDRESLIEKGYSPCGRCKP